MSTKKVKTERGESRYGPAKKVHLFTMYLNTYKYVPTYIPCVHRPESLLQIVRVKSKHTPPHVLTITVGVTSLVLCCRSSGWRWGMDKRRVDPVKVRKTTSREKGGREGRRKEEGRSI